MEGRHNRRRGVSLAPGALLLSSLGAWAQHTAHGGGSEPVLSKHSCENGVLRTGKATKLVWGHALPRLPFPAAPGKLLGETGRTQAGDQVARFADPDG